MSKFLAVRIEDEQVELIDRLVETFGGNRSDFIRLAVAERIERLTKMLESSEAQAQLQ